MARVYGHRWVSSFGEKDDGTWLLGLKGLSPDDIACGYQNMVTNNHEWPPTLPEFRRLCFDINVEEIKASAGDELKKRIGHFDYNRLTYDEMDKKIKQLLPELIAEREQEHIEFNYVMQKQRDKRLEAPE